MRFEDWLALALSAPEDARESLSALVEACWDPGSVSEAALGRLVELGLVLTDPVRPAAVYIMSNSPPPRTPPPLYTFPHLSSDLRSERSDLVRSRSGYLSKDSKGAARSRSQLWSVTADPDHPPSWTVAQEQPDSSVPALDALSLGQETSDAVRRLWGLWERIRGSRRNRKPTKQAEDLFRKALADGWSESEIERALRGIHPLVHGWGLDVAPKLEHGFCRKRATSGGFPTPVYSRERVEEAIAAAGRRGLEDLMEDPALRRAVVEALEALSQAPAYTATARQVKAWESIVKRIAPLGDPSRVPLAVVCRADLWGEVFVPQTGTELDRWILRHRALESAASHLADTSEDWWTVRADLRALVHREQRLRDAAIQRAVYAEEK